jgi:catechol 2,3-dioxygenase-like lactoylglutathione lyase family enzyme
MLTGAHILLYSTNPDADRAFFRDILEFRFVDVHAGWLIFKLPPSELAVHPGDGAFVQKHGDHDMLGSLVYLMCDDINATVKTLEGKQIACGPIETEAWGLVTSVRLPGGGYIGLYQPTHPTALNL